MPGVVGSPQCVRILGRDRFVWWGDDADGETRVPVDGRRVRTFDTADACRSWARRAAQEQHPDVETGVIDCDRIVPWLRRVSSTLDASAALDVVNMSIDVSASLGESWDPRRGRASRVYDELFAASVPWFFGEQSYSPRWRAHDLALARSVVRRSFDVLADALVAPGR